MSRLKFTRLARLDLRGIGFYIAQDNIQNAIAFVDRLEARCAKLSESPGTGRKREELGQNVRSATEGDYVIYYRVLGKSSIEILRIVHGKRDQGKIILSEGT